MAASGKRAIHWFRRDLRVTDNTALLAACRSAEEVIPAYVISAWHGTHRWTGPARQEFLCGCLEALEKNVAALGGRLVFRRGCAVDELLRLAREAEAQTIFCNRDLDPFGREQEVRLERACREAGIGFVACKDHVLHEHGEVRTKAGGGFRVYSAFFRAWRDLPKAAPAGKPRALAGGDGPGLASLGRPDLGAWGLQASGVRFVEPGERAARLRLRRALEEVLPGYAVLRDVPHGRTTSRLSQDLRFGLLSIREIYAKLIEARREASAAARNGIDAFIGELAWREFYADLLGHWPEVLEQEFDPQWRGLPWQQEEEDGRFARWTRGETGFPIVDAGMRQLRATGFLHNRVRMIVAMFLTKDLRIDWRLGERFFMQQLVDGEIANNNGGWQWSAGTGADAAPYFRIQNPWTQTRRYDPEGLYVRQWVPELAQASGRSICTPPAPGEPVWPGYPAPMVDHAEERTQTLAWFERHRARAGGKA